jgi:hypothetical protein
VHPFLKKKSTQIALVIFSTANGIFCVYSFAHQVRQTHVRFVDEDLGAAWKESRKVPEGFARGEDYLRRLKAIKTRWAPPEMKEALFDYIAAYEKGLIATEAGRDASTEAKAMAQAKDRLVAVEQKYQ